MSGPGSLRRVEQKVTTQSKWLPGHWRRQRGGKGLRELAVYSWVPKPDRRMRSRSLTVSGEFSEIIQPTSWKQIGRSLTDSKASLAL